MQYVYKTIHQSPWFPTKLIVTRSSLLSVSNSSGLGLIEYLLSGEEALDRDAMSTLIDYIGVVPGKTEQCHRFARGSIVQRHFKSFVPFHYGGALDITQFKSQLPSNSSRIDSGLVGTLDTAYSTPLFTKEYFSNTLPSLSIDSVHSYSK